MHCFFNGNGSCRILWQQDPYCRKIYCHFWPKRGGQSYTVEVESGKTVSQPKNPEYTGYTFDGWYLGDKLYDFKSPVTKSITLKAHWTPEKVTPKTVKVTFNTNGGNEINPQEIEYGTKVILPNSPTKEGFNFLAWTLDEAIFNSETPITKNIELKALWGFETASTEEVVAINSNTYVAYKSLAISLEKAVTGDTVVLFNNVETIEQINVPTGVTLDGNNKFIKANNNDWSTENGSKMLLEISSNATVKNVTLDSNKQACGVQAYTATDVKLDNVTITNSKNAGLIVNASQVTISGNLSMSGNKWGDYINLGWGSGITGAPEKCTVTFVNAILDGVNMVWTDKDDLKHACGESATQSDWSKKFEVQGIDLIQTNADSGIACVPPVAQIGSTKYASLKDAIDGAKNGDVITLIKDVEHAPGIAVSNYVDFTVDFAGHTYTLDTPGAGSSGTETNGFQLLKGEGNHTITFKNGTINISENNTSIKRIIQCYAKLNLVDMTIDGTNQYGEASYVMSFNHGEVNITGNTSVIAEKGKVAFDVDGNWGGYNRCPVTINTTGTIIGNIEVGRGYLKVLNANVEGGIVLCTSCGESETTNQADRISIKGGTFSSDPSAYVPVTCFVQKNLDDTFTVTVMEEKEAIWDDFEIYSKIGCAINKALNPSEEETIDASIEYHPRTEAEPFIKAKFNKTEVTLAPEDLIMGGIEVQNNVEVILDGMVLGYYDDSISDAISIMDFRSEYTSVDGDSHKVYSKVKGDSNPTMEICTVDKYIVTGIELFFPSTT